MKAVLCRKFGPPESLEIVEVDDPTPGPRRDLVDVRAAAVTFPDVLMIEDKYQFKPQPPFIPGGEVAGVVRAVGPRRRGLPVGDRVRGGAPAAAASPSGSSRRPSALQRLPKAPCASPTAAGFAHAYGTGYHALKDRAALKPGETLLVLGAAGGVGLAAVELGKLLGARVIAAASTDEKLAFCRAARRGRGASTTRDEDLKERAKELTSGNGVDVVYDPVGGELRRGGAARHRLAGALSGGRLRRRRHPEDPAESRAAQGLPDRRRVPRARCGRASPRCAARSARPARRAGRGAAAAARLSALFARRHRRRCATCWIAGARQGRDRALRPRRGRAPGATWRAALSRIRSPNGCYRRKARPVEKRGHYTASQYCPVEPNVERHRTNSESSSFLRAVHGVACALDAPEIADHALERSRLQHLDPNPEHTLRLRSDLLAPHDACFEANLGQTRGRGKHEHDRRPGRRAGAGMDEEFRRSTRPLPIRYGACRRSRARRRGLARVASSGAHRCRADSPCVPVSAHRVRR